MEHDYSFIPKPFATLTPYATVTNAAELIHFVESAFGGEEMERHLRPDGTIQHAQIMVGNSVLMLSEATGQYPSMPVNLFVYMPDTDASYRQALSSGASSLSEPTDQNYGRAAGVRDVCGNHWWITTPIAPAVPANLKE